MDAILKSTVMAIFGVIICQLIKKHNPELSFALSAAVSVSILLSSCLMMDQITELISFVRDLLGNSSELMKPLLKCLAISLISKFGADLCKDASMSAAASAIEAGAVFCAAGAAMPVIISTLKMLGTIV